MSPRPGLQQEARAAGTSSQEQEDENWAYASCATGHSLLWSKPLPAWQAGRDSIPGAQDSQEELI